MINIVLSAIVRNVAVARLTDTSVRVTWDRITGIPGITEYIVYYAPVPTSCRKRQSNDEQSVTVPETASSAGITNLMNTVEYQYQVVAVVMLLGGKRLVGERSLVTDNSSFTILPPETSGGWDGNDSS